MKPQILIVFVLATLSSQAQNSTPASADRPAQTAETAKAVEAAKPVANTTAAPTETATEAPQTTVMAAMEINSSSDIGSPAPDLKQELASMRAEQKAAMAREMASQAQRPKMVYAGIVPLAQPTLSMPKLPSLNGPGATVAASAR